MVHSSSDPELVPVQRREVVGGEDVELAAQSQDTYRMVLGEVMKDWARIALVTAIAAKSAELAEVAALDLGRKC